MKIVIFGLGSIGLKHAGVLSDNFSHQLYAFRSNRTEMTNKGNIKNISSWKEVDQISPDIALISNPTDLHIATAIECARCGMHLFIEKPLGASLKDLDKLLAVVKKKKLATYVAYLLRFHPVVMYVKKILSAKKFLHMRVVTSSYLPSWRAGTDYRSGYSASRKRGGGVILDLSHELDYISYITDGVKDVSAQFERRSDLTIDAEDFADILVKTNKGPANLHINFFSHINKRQISVDFKDSSLTGDLLENKVCWYKKGKLLKTVKFKDGVQDCLLKEWKYFLSNLNKRRMMNNVFEATVLFKKMHALKTGKTTYA